MDRSFGPLIRPPSARQQSSRIVKSTRSEFHSHRLDPGLVATLDQSSPTVLPFTHFPPSEIGFSATLNLVVYVWPVEGFGGPFPPPPPPQDEQTMGNRKDDGERHTVRANC